MVFDGEPGLEGRFPLFYLLVPYFSQRSRV